MTDYQDCDVKYALDLGITPRKLDAVYDQARVRELASEHRVSQTLLTWLARRWGLIPDPK